MGTCVYRERTDFNRQVKTKRGVQKIEAKGGVLKKS